MSDSTPMMQQYERLKDRQPDAILFFRLGDFYEMFRSDALEANRILGLTLTQRQGVPMCGIPHHAVRTYIPRLLLAGKKIAICEQTRMNAKGIADREIVQVITPGTLMDEDLLDRKTNNFLLSLSSPSSGIVTWALSDLSTGELEVGNTEESRGGEWLRTALARWPVQEILVQESLLGRHPALAEILAPASGLLVNRFGDWLYDIRECRRKLCTLLGLQTLAPFGLPDESRDLHPACAILQYGEEASCHPLDQIRGISFHDASGCLQLDETSVRNLELLKNIQDGGEGFSLLKLMDHTRTPMGGRLLRRWIVEPLMDRTAVDARLAVVDWFYHDQTALSATRERLGRIQDLERIANRVLADKAHPKDLLALARSLSAVDDIRNAMAGNPLRNAMDLSDEEQETIRQACGEIVSSIHPDAPANHTEGNVIAPGRDQAIDRYRKLQEDSEAILEEYLEEERALSGIPGLRVKYNRIIGYFLEASRSSLAKIPDHFVRRQSLAGGERFTTDRLMALQESILSAADSCLEREKELYISLRNALKPAMPLVVRLGSFLARADVLASFAHLATARGFVRPEMGEDRMLEITGGRHPVVESHVGIGHFIPNDCHLGTEGSPHVCALITGPNMAGKSTYLRQAALIVLMAHMGSWVPATRARIGMCDRIFCRVGASDNLARGESTFLVEMNEAAFILRQASPRSLVIMDEVGRGTSTQDGLAIARAILEHLVGVTNARCLFATHFHELSEGAGFTNLSMSVEELEGRVHFLRKVVEGPSGNSYGIHVAQLAGLPESVIARARECLAGSTPARSTPSEKTPPQGGQRDLFGPGDTLLLEIQSLDPDKLTPRKALEILYGLKERYTAN